MALRKTSSKTAKPKTNKSQGKAQSGAVAPNPPPPVWPPQESKA
jgi:hypothetical protein